MTVPQWRLTSFKSVGIGNGESIWLIQVNFTKGKPETKDMGRPLSFRHCEERSNLLFKLKGLRSLSSDCFVVPPYNDIPFKQLTTN